MLFVHTLGWDAPFPHYLYIIYSFCFRTWRVFLFWTQYNHITDGKSILSKPSSQFNSSTAQKVRMGPISSILESYCIGLMWDHSEWGVDGACQMYWRYVTQDWWALSALHSHSILERCVSYLTIDCQALLGNSAWSIVAGAAKPIEQKNQMYK